jgi:hypothetical protein
MSKSIFIHIPKCAGCSVWEVFSKSAHCQHSEPRISKAKLNLQSKFGSSTLEYFGHGVGKMSKPFPYNDKYQDFFSFTFVRNPFDRLVSSFFFLKSGGHNQYNHELYNKYMRTRSGTFKDFIMHKFNQESIDNVMHLKPQHFWAYKQNNLCIDFVGKTEAINSDLSLLYEKLGLKRLDLDTINTSDHKHYTEYYDEETKQIVAEKYAKDIEYFGYEF